MKISRVLAAFALLCFSPLSFAAPLSEYGDAVEGGTSAQLTTTASSNDLIVAMASGTTGAFSFSDGANSYATPVVVGPDEYGNYYALTWAKNVSATQLTVSVTGGTIYRVGIYGVTGFTVGPVAIPLDTSSVVITSTALVTPGFTTTKNNEFGVGLYGTNGDTLTINSADWTSAANTGSGRLGTLAALSTDGYNSATSLVFNGTVASSGAVALIQGFYDGSAAACTNNFWSSVGTFAVPNGSTGSYWSLTGAFATPNCSTGSYWLKTGAAGAT